MPDTDPSLTHAVTTREAGEGVERCQCDELRADNERLRRLEASHHETFKAGVYHQNRADAAEKEVARLKGEVDDARDIANKLADEKTELRRQLARAEAIEAAAKALSDSWDQFGDLPIGRLRDALAIPTTTTEKAMWLAVESTVYTLDESGQNRIYANFQAPNCGHYEERCELARRCAAALNATPTPTEAEVERLRGENEELRKEVNSLQSQITRESWIEGCDALQKEVSLLEERLNTRIKMTNQLQNLCDEHERTIADLRAKLDALVSAVDGLKLNNCMVVESRYRSGWSGVTLSSLKVARLAADAARQPTEDR